MCTLSSFEIHLTNKKKGILRCIIYIPLYTTVSHGRKVCIVHSQILYADELKYILIIFRSFGIAMYEVTEYGQQPYQVMSDEQVLQNMIAPYPTKLQLPHTDDTVKFKL